MSKHAARARSDDSELFHQLTGEAIRAWAQLEHSLWMIAASLLRVDQFRARILMAAMSNGKAQRNLIGNLGRTYLSEELASELQRKLKRLSSLNEERNVLVHATILVGQDGRDNRSTSDWFDPTTGLTFKRTEFPPNRVKMLRDATRKLTGELMEFSMKIKGQVHAAPSPHREDPNFNPNHAAFRPWM